MITAVVITIATSSIIFLWRYGTYPQRILRKCGVPIVPGALPFLGHSFLVLKAKHFGTYDYDNMKKYGKVFGICELGWPTLVVTDPEVLKEVLLRKFNSFTDRRKLPLRKWMKLSMVDQSGVEWKRIRAMLTPFFSVAKLKHNLSIMHQPVKCLVQNLQQIYKNDNIFEAHSVASSLSLDVICATAFSLDIDSQNDPNNQLLLTLKTLTNLSFSSPLIFLTLTFPFLSPLLEFFGVSMFPSGYLEYFEIVTKQMINERKNSDQVRPDFVQAMVKAHLEDLDYQTKVAMYGENGVNDENTKRGLTDKEIMAQVLLFILGGYDTTARTLSTLLYNLAVYPEVQEKLYNEILEQLGDQMPNYESISKLKYLDMCIMESLRLYPPVFRFDRVAAENVTIGSMTIPKGTSVTVPIWAIHHDPDLWPMPEHFDPERFSDENAAQIDQFSYLPFGTGLRGCIGSRFAQVEIKLAITQVLRSFKILTNARTPPIPLQLEQTGFFLQPKNGLWLSLEARAES